MYSDLAESLQALGIASYPSLCALLVNERKFFAETHPLVIPEQLARFEVVANSSIAQGILLGERTMISTFPPFVYDSLVVTTYRSLQSAHYSPTYRNNLLLIPPEKELGGRARTAAARSPPLRDSNALYGTRSCLP